MLRFISYHLIGFVFTVYGMVFLLWDIPVPVYLAWLALALGFLFPIGGYFLTTEPSPSEG